MKDGRKHNKEVISSRWHKRKFSNFEMTYFNNKL